MLTDFFRFTIKIVCLFAELVSWVLRQDKVRQFLKELPIRRAKTLMFRRCLFEELTY
ncbi:hypothetical protein GXM_02411 [Nostoc sphaeroides CCNUC1]|uniref:Uncharacterized protein n=1 Tax=Nostoc sphaeroides CCNUC1 TaxID=2653204 RepID=A0A5P8VXS8_9NOSO|nr:hypothetical protein GXM_02411 [Nostoc sphaeroides CCNUC1]